MPSVVIGFGVGGFFDGIVLHQVLQWHHLVSSRVSPETLDGLRLNILADGIFHQVMSLTTVIGLVLLYRALADPARHPRPALLGGILLGFGLFNVLDSLVLHWTLGLHHIRPGPNVLVYDAAFLAWGVAMTAAGWWKLRATPDRSRGRNG